MSKLESIRVLIPKLPSTDALLPWLLKIDRSRHYTNFGPLCKQLEHELGALVGAPLTVCVSSGTIGLELALQGLRLRPGGIVLVPAHTFPATATAIVRSGHTPIFSDVDEGSLVLTPDIARAAAAKKNLDAVLAVSLHGNAQDVEQWDAFTADTGVPVLVDAAGTIGRQDVGRSTAVVFSLHATKPLAAGEGGLVASRSPSFAEYVRAHSNFGFHSGYVVSIGTNGKMSEYHAAIGLAALSAWQASSARRQSIYDEYKAAFERRDFGGRIEAVTRSSYSSNFCVRVPPELIECLVDKLTRDGIETRRWYWPPLHRHPAFSAFPHADNLEVTCGIADQVLGLPFHVELDSGDVLRVCDGLLRHLG